MARSHGKDPSISQRNDASSIGNQRRMARRAKIQSNKTDRQRLQKDLLYRYDDQCFHCHAYFTCDCKVIPDWWYY
jgi:hypothetical protein